MSPQYVLLALSALVGLAWVQSAPTTPVTTCGTNPADIHFLLDSSGSVQLANFQTQLDFVKKFANSFDIGPNGVQIGVTTFSTTPHNEFWMNTHQDKASLVKAIDAIQYPGG
ncbi:collagen alpha-1(xii) chain [Plakobranchus ocellatus]|uniref:Collagen alpha-1(Xii) chain n=1 Tax=Plakobranchus ocellatus TaxID=259542 RepID=A0AAV4BU52_9GAST|nr:collagen alpha-1(xii) chain [Plakobranchus ocellatus]